MPMEVLLLETVTRIFELADKKFKEQKDFAMALDVSTTMISAWRTGTSKSYRTRLPQIAKVLDTTASYLLGEDEKPATVAGDGPDPELWELLKRIPEDRMPEVERYLRFQAEQKEKP